MLSNHLKFIIMKTFLFIALFLSALGTSALYAQEQLPVVALPATETLHFISPEPIQYVDISAKNLIGDLPIKNVLRLKRRDTTAFTGAVVTIAGEKFMAQYRLLPGNADAPNTIAITPADMKPLDIAGIGLSQNQLKRLALDIFAAKVDGKIERKKAFGIEARLNHVYTLGDYIFLDIGYHDKTRLRYDIADMRFSVDDKKVTKAANSQSVEIRPVFVLVNVPSFSSHYRNIFVFKKMSFPGNKVLRAELSEQQQSGRVIDLTISYQDILDADTPPSA